MGKLQGNVSQTKRDRHTIAADRMKAVNSEFKYGFPVTKLRLCINVCHIVVVCIVRISGTACIRLSVKGLPRLA